MDKITHTLLATSALTALVILAGCTDIPEHHVDRLQYADLRDSDNDGVVNQRDICTETPKTSDVNNVGCSQWHLVPRVADYTVAFNLDRYNIRPDQHSMVDTIVNKLKENTKTNVLLIGDTSSEGSLAYNDRLARKRAATITNALTKAGISRERITEHYFTQQLAIVKSTLKSRQRRTVALIYSDKLAPKEAWTIYTTEHQDEGGKKW
ncbi:OmpA family protein [Sinobacterium caligoides]|uniref:OmpA family protein n=1 Tax=Sinobacterium caligoides TaxID=933926 RepID=A0A3N2DJE8_9GAMM|nr:OmpA family protein [Sinobacterium caligoides]ROR99912.1 OmpA family protein [Sinobacterium caligoides]